MYTYLSDINCADVWSALPTSWTAMAYKERDIPIPAKLVKKLKAWKAKADKTCALVFPDCWLQPEAGFSRLLESVRGAREAEQGQLLPTQVPRDVRNKVPVGRC
jgi:hypothetical protein